jgi:hypothetical protein
LSGTGFVNLGGRNKAAPGRNLRNKKRTGLLGERHGRWPCAAETPA